MTDDDQLDDDDLQLKQMRSVWLSMRDDDEAPPDRGMAALMAAAREQAEQMKPKASWWSRLIEQMRRPPVLAFATVILLIGGAVAISTKKDKGEMAPPSTDQVAAPVAQAPAATPTPIEPPPPVVEGAVVAEDKADQKAPPAKGPEPVRRRAGPKRDLAEKKQTEWKADTAKSESLSFEDGLGGAPMEIAGSDGDMQAKGGATKATTATQQQERPTVTRKPLPSIEGEDRTAKDAGIAQLLKQCEAAAAKNDCASVRSIANKIAQQDPATYRNRVVKNANVARCLEPAPPVEAAPAPAE